ncbi:Protein fam86a [Cladochytrium tenue]|nr:Protein fam86a [Cladochytrium tenue]
MSATPYTLGSDGDINNDDDDNRVDATLSRLARLFLQLAPLRVVEHALSSAAAAVAASATAAVAAAVDDTTNEPLLQPWGAAFQRQVLDLTVAHPARAAHPPPRDYATRFLTCLLRRVDAAARAPSTANQNPDDVVEPCDELVDLWSAYTVGAAATATSTSDTSHDGDSNAEDEGDVDLDDSRGNDAWCFKTYLSPPSPPPAAHHSAAAPWMTLQEDGALIRAGTTGLRTWPAALRLIEVLAAGVDLPPAAAAAAGRRPLSMRGLRVLELGAGPGAVAVACAHFLGAAAVTASDANPSVLSLLRRNVRLNAPRAGTPAAAISASAAPPPPPPPPIAVVELDWEAAADVDVRALAANFDAVVAADVVFNPVLAAPLARVLAALLLAPPPPRPTLDDDAASRDSSPPPAAAEDRGVGAGPRFAVVAHTPRAESTADLFLRELAARGLQYCPVPAAADVPFWYFADEDTASVIIYFITPSAHSG